MPTMSTEVTLSGTGKADVGAECQITRREGEKEKRGETGAPANDYGELLINDGEWNSSEHESSVRPRDLSRYALLSAASAFQASYRGAIS